MRIVPHLGAIHAALVARVFRRNLVGISLFEFTWGLGCPFGLYVTIVPAYLTALGAAKSLIGFAMALWTILAPMQLLGGHFFSGRRRLRTAVIVFLASIAVRFLHDLAVVLAPGSGRRRPPSRCSSPPAPGGWRSW